MEFLKSLIFGILVALSSVNCFAADEAEEKSAVTEEVNIQKQEVKKICDESVSPKIHLLKGGRLI